MPAHTPCSPPPCELSVPGRPGAAHTDGAIAQTWEDPRALDEATGLTGDNDPIDVLQLNKAPCARGAIQRVRVLGALALIDAMETDWKRTRPTGRRVTLARPRAPSPPAQCL